MHPERQSKYHPKPYKVQILNWPMKAGKPVLVFWSSMDESDDNNYM